MQKGYIVLAFLAVALSVGGVVGVGLSIDQSYDYLVGTEFELDVDFIANRTLFIQTPHELLNYSDNYPASITLDIPGNYTISFLNQTNTSFTITVVAPQTHTLVLSATTVPLRERLRVYLFETANYSTYSLAVHSPQGRYEFAPLSDPTIDFWPQIPGNYTVQLLQNETVLDEAAFIVPQPPQIPVLFLPEPPYFTGVPFPIQFNVSNATLVIRKGVSTFSFPIVQETLEFVPQTADTYVYTLLVQNKTVAQGSFFVREHPGNVTQNVTNLANVTSQTPEELPENVYEFDLRNYTAESRTFLHRLFGISPLDNVRIGILNETNGTAEGFLVGIDELETDLYHVNATPNNETCGLFTLFLSAELGTDVIYATYPIELECPVVEKPYVPWVMNYTIDFEPALYRTEAERLVVTKELLDVVSTVTGGELFTMRTEPVSEYVLQFFLNASANISGCYALEAAASTEKELHVIEQPFCIGGDEEELQRKAFDPNIAYDLTDAELRVTSENPIWKARLITDSEARVFQTVGTSFSVQNLSPDTYSLDVLTYEDSSFTWNAFSFTVDERIEPPSVPNVSASPQTPLTTEVPVTIRDPQGRTRELVFEREEQPKRSFQVLGTSSVPQTSVKAEVPGSFIETVRLKGYEPQPNTALGLDDAVPVDRLPLGKADRIFAVDPTELEFDTGEISLTAVSDELWKCAAWDFNTQQCTGEWKKLRNLVPGETYSITFTAADPAFAEVGLASINTEKAQYHPLETAEVTMVVLDTQGFLVANATVGLLITDPNGGEDRFTTNNDTIHEESAGIYTATYEIGAVEGNYTMFVEALAEDVNNSMLSHFVVSSFYEFDILRETPVTIDPALGPFVSSITITSFVNDTHFSYTEVLPGVFTLFESTGASVSQNADFIAMTWNGVQNGTQVNYTFNTPNITPELYELGPSTVFYGNETFEEARPWYLAVDPQFDGAETVDVSISVFNETTFVIGYIDGADTHASFQIYDTDGTNLVAEVDVNTGVDVQGRVDVTTINTTTFIINVFDDFATDNENEHYIYDITGAQQLGQTSIDADSGTNVDIAVGSLGDRIVFAWIDDQNGNDLHGEVWDYAGTRLVNEFGIDNNVNPGSVVQNTADVAVLNSTRWLIGYFDDNANDARIAVQNEVGGNVIGGTAGIGIDTNIGETGQVAVAALPNLSYGMIFYDSSTSEMYLTIGNVTGDAHAFVMNPTVIDATPGTDARVDITEVRFNGESYLAAIWWDQADDVIELGIWDHLGNQLIAPFTVIDNPDATFRIPAISGGSSVKGTTLCDGRFIVAFSNVSDVAVFERYNVWGGKWNGDCNADGSAPTVTSDSPADSASVTSTNVTFFWNVSEERDTAVQCNLTVSGTVRAAVFSPNGTANTTVYLEDGDHTWNVTCMDIAGNIANSATRSLTVDVAQGDVGPEEATDVDLAALDNTTLVVAWIDSSTNITSFEVWDTNGTLLVGRTDVDTTGGLNSRISVDAANSTHFVIGLIDDPEDDFDFFIYERDGSQYVGRTEVDANLGTNTDVDICAMGDRFGAVWADDNDNDANVEVWYNTGVLNRSEVNADGNMDPQATGQNLIACEGINASRFVVSWFDDQANDATVRAYNDNATNLGARISDGDVGETGQVAIVGLRNKRFAQIFYDSGDDALRFELLDFETGFTLVSGDVDIDTSVGGSTRVAGAEIEFDGESHFAVVWQDENAGDIKAAVYDADGLVVTAPFTVATDEDDTFVLVEAVGTNSVLGGGLCDGKFAVAYTNSADQTRYVLLNEEGSVWNGICVPDTTPPTITLHQPENNSNQVVSNLTFNWTTVDNVASTTVCNLTVGGITRIANVTATNGSVNLQVDTAREGTVPWFVSCVDGRENLGFSALGQFTVDVPSYEIDTDAAVDIDTTALDNTTIVVAWIDSGSGHASFEIWDTAGTMLVPEIDLDTTVDNESRIAVDRINTTFFALSVIDGPEDDYDFYIYDRFGNQTKPATQIDGNTGQNTDAAVCQISDRFVTAWADSQDNDANFEVYYNDGDLNRTEFQVDGGANPGDVLNNLVDCVAINTTHWVYSWFDDPSNDSTISVRDSNGSFVVNRDMDGQVGDNSQNSIAGLSDSRVVQLFYQSDAQNITFELVEINGATITAINTDVHIDTNVGPTSRVSASEIIVGGESHFVAAWQDTTEGDIKAGVYDINGSEITAPFVITSNEHLNRTIIDVAGHSSVLNLGTCENTFTITYTNATGSIILDTFFYTGERWSGICDRSNPLLAFGDPTPTSPAQTINTSLIINATMNESTLQDFEIVIDDVRHSIFNTNLALMFNLDNVSGINENDSYVVDVSTNALTGNVTGAVVNTTDCRYNSCFQFDGTGDFINASNPSALGFTGNFTVAMWLYDTNAQDDTQLEKGDSYFITDSRSAGGCTESGRWQFAVRLSDTDACVEDTTTHNLNQWYHVVGVKNDTHISIYVDGQFKARTAHAGGVDDDGLSLLIGSDDDTGNDFIGRIDEVRIFAKPLNVTDIAHLYASNLNKFNDSKWSFYANETDFDIGFHTYQLRAVDTSASIGITEQRSFAVFSQQNVDNDPFLDIDVAALDNQTLVVAWIDAQSFDASFQVRNTNGTVHLAEIDVDVSGDNKSRIAVTPINTTDFVIGVIDSPEDDFDFYIYNKFGDIIQGATAIDTNTENNTDVSLCQLGDRFVAAWTEDQSDNANFEIWGNDGVQIVNQIAADGNMGPEEDGQNLVDCATMSTTRWMYVWFDDASANDATISLRDEAGVGPIGAADIDTDVGERAQVAVAGLQNSHTAFVFFDDTDNHVTIEIRDTTADSSYVTVLNNLDIDTSPGEESRVGIAEIQTDGLHNFVVAWQDRGDNTIKAAVYNQTGTEITAPFSVTSLTNESYLLLDVVSDHQAIQPGLCNETFVVAYTNSTGHAIFDGFTMNGSNWHGYCDFDGPTVVLDQPPNDANILTSTSVLNATLTDINHIVNATFLYRPNNASQWSIACIDSTIVNGVAECTWDLNGLAEGTDYQVAVYGEDIAGNIGANDTHTGIFVSLGLPIIHTVECSYDNVTWFACTNLSYRDNFIGTRVNCTTETNQIANVTFNLTNIPDQKEYFVNTTFTNEGDFWILYHNTTLDDSGDFLLNSQCTDNESLIRVSSINWSIDWGTLSSQLIDPTQDREVAQNTTFNFQADLTCTGGECGNMNATLSLLGDWWNVSWPHRQQINVTHTAENVTEYQVQVTLDTATLINDRKMQGDCGDVRAISSSNTEIDFYVEEAPGYACNTSNTLIWVQVPNIRANISNYFHLYYGHPTIGSTSSISGTFSYSGTKEIYYLVSENTDTALAVISYEDSNQIISNFNDESISLDEGERSLAFTAPDVAVGNSFNVSGAMLSAATTSGTADVLSPISWAGTEFLDFIDRGTFAKQFLIYAPFEPTDVTFYSEFAGNATLILRNVTSLAQDEWQSLLVSFNNTPGAPAPNTTEDHTFRINASAPILLAFEQGGGDVNIMHPADTDMWGLDGGDFVSGSDGNAYSLYQHDTTESHGVFNETDQIRTSHVAQGSGSALHMNSTELIGGSATADSDGGDKYSFQPEWQLERQYYLPVGGDYLAGAATGPVSCSFISGSFSHGLNTSINQTYPTPSKLCVGPACQTGGTNLGEYWSTYANLTCDVPVFVMYDDSDEDETNVYGRKSARQYTWPEPQVVYGTEEFFTGTVNTTPGALPFWAQPNNPFTASNLACLFNMTDGQTCTTQWTVNATGPINTTWEFFILYDPTNYSTYIPRLESQRVNVTIVDTVRPLISGVECNRNNTGFVDCSQIGFGDNITQIRANCSYALDAPIVNMSFHLTNVDDNRTYFNNVTLDNATGSWLLNLTNVTVTDSGDFNLQSTCVVDTSTTRETDTLWFVPFGTLSATWINPQTNINATFGRFSNFTTNVTCSGGECLNLTGLLDPRPFAVPIAFMNFESPTDFPQESGQCGTGGIYSCGSTDPWDNFTNCRASAGGHGMCASEQANSGPTGTYGLQCVGCDNGDANNLGGLYIEINDTACGGVACQAINLSFYQAAFSVEESGTEGAAVFVNDTDGTLRLVDACLDGDSCEAGTQATMGDDADFITTNVCEIAGIDCSEPITIRFTSAKTEDHGGGDIFSWDEINVTGYITKGAIPENTGVPFYTSSTNPRDWLTEPCLDNMTDGDVCELSWLVNSTGPIGSTHEFFAVYNATRSNNANNETLTYVINVTIVSQAPPLVSELSLTPAGPTPSSNLYCNFTLHDPNYFDTLIANITWYLNDVEYSNFSVNVTNDVEQSIELGSGNTSVGQVWHCGVQGYDQIEWGPQRNSSPVQILISDPPVVTNVQCRNSTVWGDCSVLQFDHNLTAVRANCNDPDGTVADVRFNFTNLDDSFLYFSNSSLDNSSGFYVFDNNDIQIKDSGTFNLTVDCTDDFNVSTTGNAEWFVAFGNLTATFDQPTSDINMTRFTFGTFRANLTCEGGECNNVTAVLDPLRPYPQAFMDFESSNFPNQSGTCAIDGTNDCSDADPWDDFDECEVPGGTGYGVCASQQMDAVGSRGLECVGCDRSDGGNDGGFYIELNVTDMCNGYTCQRINVSFYHAAASMDNANEGSAVFVNTTDGTLHQVANCSFGDPCAPSSAASLGTAAEFVNRDICSIQNVNCSQNLTLFFTSLNTVDHGTGDFFGWDHINVTGYGEKGIIPMHAGDPFYTIHINPRNSSALSCLFNMTAGDECTIEWDVNATGTIGLSHEVFVYFNSTVYPTDISQGETEHFFVTIQNNTAPYVKSVAIGPASPLNTTDLNCTFTLYDPNAFQNLTANITWYRNGTALNFSTATAVNNETTTVFLDSGSTEVGDEWHCGVEGYDGLDWGAQANSTNVTILLFPPPTIFGIQCNVSGVWGPCSNVQYHTNFSMVRVNCTSNEGMVNATFNFTNVQDNTTFFLNVSSNVSGELITFDNEDINMTDSGDFIMDVECVDTQNQRVRSADNWSIDWGTLGVTLVDPSTDSSVQTNDFFDFEVTVTCTGGECGTANATLDPFNASALYDFTFSFNQTRFAFEVDSDNNPPEDNPNQRNALNSTHYGLLNASDNSRRNTLDPGGGDYVSMEYIFQLNQSRDNMTQVDLIFEGQPQNTVDMRLYARDIIADEWDSITSRVFPADTDDTLVGVITAANVTRYINSTNAVRWLLLHDDLDDIMRVDYAAVNVSYIDEKAIVSMSEGDTPFYTTDQNPRNATNSTCLQNLTSGDSCTIIWAVNATGLVDSRHEFFAYANSTEYPQFVPAVESTRIDITIVDAVNVPPSVVLNLPTDNTFTNNPSVNFSCNVTDNIGLENVTLFADFNGSFVANQTEDIVGAAFNAQFNKTLSDGVYSWNCLAYDIHDNFDWGIANRTVTVDTVEPTIILNFPVNNANITFDDIPFNVTVIDALDSSLTCNLTLDSVNQYTNVAIANNTPTILPVNDVSIAQHQWEVACIDDTGNRNISELYEFEILDTPPNVTLITAEGFVFASENITLVYNASDSIGVTLTELFINDRLNQTYNNPQNGVFNSFNVSNLTEGKYNWTVNASDVSGLFDTATERNFTIDLTPPNISLNLPPDNFSTGSSRVGFNFTATDNFAATMTCNATLDGVVNVTGISAPNNTLTDGEFTGLQDGIHTWNVSCSDEGGRFNTSETRRINISEPPTVVLNSPATNFTQNTQTITLTYTPTDNTGFSRCDLLIDGIFNQTNTSSGVSNGAANTFEVEELPEGFYNWSVDCTDTIGLSNLSEERVFIIDLTQPNITLLRPTPGELWFGRFTNFNFSVIDNFDPVLTCNITVDGSVRASGISAPNNTPTNLSVNVSDEGLHYWNVTCIDEGNNINVSVTQNYTSANPPEVTLISPADNALLFSVPVILSYVPVDENLTNATLILNGVDNQTNTSLQDESLNFFNLNPIADGIYTWTVNVSDISGLSTTPQARTFTLDTTAPNVTLIEPNNETVDWNNITFRFQVADNLASTSVCNVTINDTLEFEGISVSNNTQTIRYKDLVDGNYNWSVTCVDDANNTNLFDLVNFTVEAPPNVTLILPPNGTRTNQISQTFTYVPYDLYGLNNCSLLIDDIINQTNTTILNNQNNTFFVENISEGLHNWTVQCIDADPDFNPFTPDPFPFRIDLTGPTIFLGQPEPNEILNSNNVTFNYTAIDSDSISITCNVTVSNPPGADRVNTTTELSGVDHNVTVNELNDGQHYWNVTCVDDLGNVNTSETLGFIVNQPDLVVNVTTILFNDTNPDLNDSIEVTANVTNLGGLPATNLLIEIYDGPREAGTRIGNTTIDLGINQTATVSTIFNITPGFHVIHVLADPNNTITELFEENNNATNNISVLLPTINAPLPDLYFNVSSVTFNLTVADFEGYTVNYTGFIDELANFSGTENDNQSFLITINFTEGTHDVVLQANSTRVDFQGAGLTRIKNSSITNITIDLTNPVPTFVTENDTWFNVDTPTINFTITDNIDPLIHFKLYRDGVVVNESDVLNGVQAGIVLSPIANGSYTLILEGTDDAGNVQNSTPIVIHVDTVPPDAVITTINHTNFSDVTPQIDFILTDNLAPIINYTIFVNFSQDQIGNATNNTAAFDDLTSQAEGEYLIQIEAVDLAGNRFNSSIITITVDATAPNVTIDNPQPNEVLGHLIQLLTTITDNTLSIDTAYFELRNATNGDLIFTDFLLENQSFDTTWNSTQNISSDNDTNLINFTVFANDSIGNPGSASIIFIVDNKNPTIDIFHPLQIDVRDSFFLNITVENTHLNQSSYNITNTTGDQKQNRTNSSINISSYVWGDFVNITNTTKYPEGVYNISVFAEDVVGNNHTRTTFFRIDRTPPTINATAPNDTINFTGSNISFNYSVFDNLDTALSCSVVLNGTVINQSTLTNGSNISVFEPGLSEGTHFWNVTCGDDAGNNQTTATRRFTIDNTAPTIGLGDPENYTFQQSGDVTFLYTPYEPHTELLNCSLLIDDVINATNTTIFNGVENNFTTFNLNEGTYLWTVNCTDTLGFTGTNSTPKTIVIDQTPPDTVLLTANHTYFNIANPNISFRITDNLDPILNYTVFINGVEDRHNITANNSNASYALTPQIDGEYNITIEALDSAGNALNSSILTIFIDTEAPNVTGLYPENNTVLVQLDVNFTWIVTDNLDPNLACNITVNDVTNLSQIPSINNTVTNQSILHGPGTFSWYVSCIDNASNYDDSGILYFNITPPDVTLNDSDIYANQSYIREGENITIFANVSNIGSGIAQNIDVEFFHGFPDTGVALGATQTITELGPGEKRTLNTTWISVLGNQTIFVRLDNSNTIIEQNEVNNNASTVLNVSSWSFFTGNTTGDLALRNNVTFPVFLWNTTNATTGNIYITDSDSQVSFADLIAFTRNLTGAFFFDDFADLDSVLNSTSFQDSINNTFTVDGGLRASQSIFVFNKLITNIPIANSTNNSNFVTGILWDTSDPNPGHYNGSPDVVFVSPINRQAQGAYGMYDFEVRAPSELKKYIADDSASVALYAEFT